MKEQTKTQLIEKENKLHKFDEGSVISVLWKTALPIIILMLFNSAYSFVDSLMSSSYVDYGVVNGNQLNGGTSIGLIFPLMSILMAFEVMIAVGGGLAYTQAISQKDYVGAKQKHNESISMIIYMSILILIVIAIIGIPYLLTVSGNWGKNPQWGDSTWGPAGEIEHGMILDGYYYMLILGIAFLPMQINQSYIRVLRAEGKGDIAALIPILTFPINIFFDWLLMSQINMGLIGAGIATLLASSAGMFFMFIYIWYMGKADKLNITLQIPNIRVHKEIVTIILMFAMGSLIRRLFDGGSVIILSAFVGNMHVKPDAIDISNWTGSWTIMTRSINMGAMLSLGVAQSISMLVSYYSFSGQSEKTKDTVKYGFLLMLMCSLFSTFLLMGLQEILFRAYNPETLYGFEWWNSISIAFVLALIYSIPFSLQPIAIMVYAGMKKPKLTLYHSLTFNGVLLLFTTFGFILEVTYNQPLFLFGSIALGSIFAFIIVMLMFKYWYKVLVPNNI